MRPSLSIRETRDNSSNTRTTTGEGRGSTTASLLCSGTAAPDAVVIRKTPGTTNAAGDRTVRNARTAAARDHAQPIRTAVDEPISRVEVHPTPRTCRQPAQRARPQGGRCGRRRQVSRAPAETAEDNERTKDHRRYEHASETARIARSNASTRCATKNSGARPKTSNSG